RRGNGLIQWKSHFSHRRRRHSTLSIFVFPVEIKRAGPTRAFVDPDMTKRNMSRRRARSSRSQQDLSKLMPEPCQRSNDGRAS
ncbi:MAG TPA: hypothetical protein VJ859_04085, partial [Allosphingosinicella sp.]|nr:hypothetical protein [Allosphingosinicella sp.]